MKLIYRVEKALDDTDLTEFWPGLEGVAYAFYNKENVFLYHHPKFMTEDKKANVLQWDSQFTGDTLILYEGHPTAIVGLDRYENFESLYSILVHELFHGFQFLKEEKRYPNELDGIRYPLLRENIELRSRERVYLYNAVLASTLEDRSYNLADFFALREKRKSILGDLLQYEALTETIEGPAFYVELKAYSRKSVLSNVAVLRKYGSDLVNKHASSLNIRKSCYSSGLFICLFLDDIYPDWQQGFFASEKTLYEYAKQFVELEEIKIDDVTISEETEEIMKLVSTIKEKEFNEFTNKRGSPLIIEGEIISKMIDPMNIIQIENKQLHKNFLGVSINDIQYLFEQPTIAYYKEDNRTIYKLYLVLDQPPIISNGILKIRGVGNIKGECFKKDNIFHLSTI